MFRRLPVCFLPKLFSLPLISFLLLLSFLSCIFSSMCVLRSAACMWSVGVENRAEGRLRRSVQAWEAWLSAKVLPGGLEGAKA